MAEEKPGCSCEYSKKFRVTEWGDIVPTDMPEEELEALRKARSK
jgi:hypothetical protein